MAEFRCGRNWGRSTHGGSGPGLKLVRNSSRGARQIRPARLDGIASGFLASIYNLQGIALEHLYDYCAGDEIFYLQSL